VEQPGNWHRKCKHQPGALEMKNNKRLHLFIFTAQDNETAKN
jgi:hypothetical protein